MRNGKVSGKEGGVVGGRGVHNVGRKQSHWVVYSKIGVFVFSFFFFGVFFFVCIYIYFFFTLLLFLTLGFFLFIIIMMIVIPHAARECAFNNQTPIVLLCIIFSLYIYIFIVGKEKKKQISAQTTPETEKYIKGKSFTVAMVIWKPPHHPHPHPIISGI